MIYFFAGLLSGIVLAIVVLTRRFIGSIRIDSSIEDGPYLFLELTKELSIVGKKKYALVHIDRTNYLPRN